MSTRMTDPEGILLSIDRILPNPWQTRQAHAGDDEHVSNLAADIRARGLLQPPLGRTVLVREGEPTVPWEMRPLSEYSIMLEPKLFVQLAFGHNRLAAYRLLAEQYPDEHWDRIPLRIAPLDDQAMALAAWSENAARKDISPLEAAQALQRLSTDFGWTQDQIAEQCNMARSTVANKLRLLRLPEKLLKQLHEGEISERQALSVLPAFELPEVAQTALEELRKQDNWMVRRLDEALAHPAKKTSSDVRDVIREAVFQVTSPLSNSSEKEYSRAGFPVDREIDGVAAPACLNCENRLRDTRCADRACYDRKQTIFEAGEVAFAAAATGLPTITNAELHEMAWNAQAHFGGNDREGLQRALDQHCPNLHLYYDRREPDAWSLRVPDYPHVAYVCVRGEKNTVCDCAHAEAARRQAKMREEQERREKEGARLRECTVKELTAALRAQDLGAWHAVLWALRVYNYHTGNAEKVATMNAKTTLENIARAVLSVAVDWTNPAHKEAAAALAEWRKKVGWLPAAPVGEKPKDIFAGDDEPDPGHCGTGCPHYSRCRNMPYCELRDCETTIGAKCTATTNATQVTPAAAEPAPAADVDDVDEEAPEVDLGLQPCNIGCVGFQSLSSGRYYCTLIDSEIDPGDLCQHYQAEAVDLVVAAVGEEEEAL